MMNKAIRGIAAAAAMVIPLVAMAPLSPASAVSDASDVNPAPVVVPSLHEWSGGSGRTDISASSRIVVSTSTQSIGEEFSDDLANMTGLDLQVVTGASQPGDITLLLAEDDSYAAGGERYDKEGYKLDIAANGVSVTAPTETGVFYGTRSILQIMVQSNGRNSLPVGTSVDWPDYEARGFILDVGRHFFTADFINDYIKMMSYYKLNRFQIHLSDNQIFVDNNDWRNSYMGFRLKSDNPKYAGLASADGSYDKDDWAGFESTALSHGVQIIPEIDVPAHSAAIIKWRPDIGLDSGKSDHLDLSKPETTTVIQGIFDEFMPWFKGAEVNFGADEYPGDKLQYRQFYNDMAAHIRAAGKQPGAWGSFTAMSENTGFNGVEGYDTDVIINSWNNRWYGLDAAAADDMRFINTNDGTLYVVPFAGYYHGNGLDNQWLYNNWLPNQAGGQEVEPDEIMGSMFAVWNDMVNLDYTQQDVHSLIERSFPVVAQKTWTAQTPAVTYSQFNSVLDTIGMGPALAVVKDSTPVTGAADLATGKPVVASSSKAQYPAENLTDGDQNTRWESADSSPATLTIDLGSVQKIGGISAEWAANAPSSYAVETSKDGLFWDVVATHDVAAPGSDAVRFPTTEARYVRLSGLAPASVKSAGVTGLADTGAATVAAWRLGVEGVSNVALGAVATSSGVEGGTTLSADQAFDGNHSTRWSGSNSAVRWIAGDLGEEQSINEVTIEWESASAKSYTVSTSLDGSTWTVVATKTNMAAGKRTDVVSFEPVNTRHLKVEIQEGTMAGYLSAYEIEARNTQASALRVAGSLDGTPNAEGKYDVEPTVTLQATGAAAGEANAKSGVEVEYRVGDGEWTVYAAPFTVAGQGLTTVGYRATSGAETFLGYVVLDLATPNETEEPSAEPTDPGTTEPTEPATVEPTEPGTTEPTEPATTQPTEPATVDPTEPGTTEPTVPGTTQPTEPGTTQPTEPGTTQPTEPGTTQPTEPGTTEPATVEPTDPGTTQPTEPATVEPTIPPTTDPAVISPTATASNNPEVATTSAAAVVTSGSGTDDVATSAPAGSAGLASTGASVSLLLIGGMLMMGAGSLALIRRRSSRGRYQG